MHGLLSKLLLAFFLGIFSLLVIPVNNISSSTTYAQTTTVSIKNNSFSQKTVTIKAGSSVTWRNDDSAIHTSTADNPGIDYWSSPILNNGQTYTKIFTLPGTYTYHCDVHPNMTGTIIVTAAEPTTVVSTPTPTPTPYMGPSFACLGGCITPTPKPTTPAPTDIVPTTDPCADSTIQTHVEHDVMADHNKGGKSKGGSKPSKSKPSKSKAPDNSLLGVLLQFLLLLLQLIGVQPAPPSVPVPVPTDVPHPTEEPLPTTNPTPCPAKVKPTIDTTPQPTSTDMKSIDEIKYQQGTEALRKFDLIAEPLDGSSTTWTFNSDLSSKKIPGPEWRVVQGDHVRVNFQNKLPESTAIHWHGVRVFASQDGVAGVTQNSVPPGGSYQYDFIVPDSGTYWYHPHMNSQQQVPKGLMGAIVVSPRIATDEPAYQKDHTIFFRNVASPTTTQLAANPGEKVRLRIVNAREPDFSGTTLKVALVGAPFKVIRLDGQAINQPQEISDQLLELGMANRYDLEFTMPATGSVQLLEQENKQTHIIGQGAAPTLPNLNTLPVFSYLNYGVTKADPRLPKTTFDAEYTLTIGANLSINGQLFPNIPDIVVKKGQLTKLTYVNNSNTIHPMHLHGQFYTVLKVNGTPITGSPIHLDTVLVKPGETVEVAVLADNEGIWMLHCHVFGHQASGMMMMNRYENVYTPYKHGTGTGNEAH